MFHYKHSKIIPQFPADPETRTHRRFIWGGDLGKQEGGHGGGRQRGEWGKGESPHSHRGRQRCPAGFSPTVSSDGPTGGDGEARCSPLEPCPPFLRWLRVALGMVTPGRFRLSKLPWCQESPKLRSRGEQVLVARSGPLGEKCLSVNAEAGGGDTVAIYGIC